MQKPVSFYLLSHVKGSDLLERLLARINYPPTNYTEGSGSITGRTGAEPPGEGMMTSAFAPHPGPGRISERSPHASLPPPHTRAATAQPLIGGAS